MTRILYFTLVAVATLAFAMGMGGGVVAAENATNQTDPDEIVGDLEAEEIEDRTGWLAIDSETYITDWEYADRRFTIDVYADQRTTITMAESADWEEGEGQYVTTEETVPAGNSTMTIETFADRSDGVALSFATQLSMQEERGPYISSGTSAEDPFQHFGGTSGLFSGVAMTTLLAALAAGIVVWQEDSGVVKA